MMISNYYCQKDIAVNEPQMIYETLCNKDALTQNIVDFLPQKLINFLP